MTLGHGDIVQSTILSVDSQVSVEVGILVVRIFLEKLSKICDRRVVGYSENCTVLDKTRKLELNYENYRLAMNNDLAKKCIPAEMCHLRSNKSIWGPEINVQSPN